MLTSARIQRTLSHLARLIDLVDHDQFLRAEGKFKAKRRCCESHIMYVQAIYISSQAIEA